MPEKSQTLIFQLGAYILKAQKLLAVLSGLSLALLMAAQVILRYWLHLPILGIEEASVLLGLWVYFLGAAYITWTDEHIKGGVANLIFKSNKSIFINEVIIYFICILVSIVLSYHAIVYFTSVLDVGRSSIYLRWPTTLWVGSMVIGFVLMNIYLLINFVKLLFFDAKGIYGND